MQNDMTSTTVVSINNVVSTHSTSVLSQNRCNNDVEKAPFNIGYTIPLRCPKDMMQNSSYSTLVIRTTDVEGYNILVQLLQQAMQNVRHSTSVLGITVVEGNTFYIGLLLITDAECSLFKDGFYKTPVFVNDIFYIGLTIVVAGCLTFYIACYYDTLKPMQNESQNRCKKPVLQQ